MRARNEIREIRRRAIRGRILKQHSKDRFIDHEFHRRRCAHFNAQRLRARLQYGQVLRMTLGGRHEHITGAFAFHRVTHGHGLGAGGSLVE